MLHLPALKKSLSLFGLVWLLLIVAGTAQSQGFVAEQEKIASVFTSGRDSVKEKLAQRSQDADAPERERLLALLDELDRQELFQELDLVQRHPADARALGLLASRIHRQAGEEHVDRIITAFESLSDSLKNTQVGKSLQASIARLQASSPGQAAPLFKGTDRSGKTFVLEDLRDKNFILLDFWASWCSPCRGDFPFLKELVDAYSSKGFRVVAVSRDDDLYEWKAAIEKESIGGWIHLSTKLNADNVLDKYFVWAIPVKILIDRNGKIVGRWRGASAANKKEITAAIRALAER